MPDREMTVRERETLMQAPEDWERIETNVGPNRALELAGFVEVKTYPLELPDQVQTHWRVTASGRVAQELVKDGKIPRIKNFGFSKG